jgi:SagB-type dehydrogenase family enzyme
MNPSSAGHPGAPGNSAAAAAGSAAPIEWPQQILDRIQRVADYHQTCKLTVDLHRNLPSPDSTNRPNQFVIFDSAPKIDLPTALISADAPTVSLLLEGRSSVPESQLDPPHNLRTLATWLYLANGLTVRQRSGSRASWRRTLPSSSGAYPCEMYVAAFAIGGLEPGLYHYSPREFSLRQLRAGLEVLAHLKRGRPDLEFLKTIPGAVLVSTIFPRSTWMYHRRGYQVALLDAGAAVENLMQAGAAMGLHATARLHLSDQTTRALIGVAPDAPFEQSEAVQAMVAWANPSGESLTTALGPAPLPPISRAPLAAKIEVYDLVPAVHQDCIAPGVAIREIRPPLTELTPLPDNIPAFERPPVEQPHGGRIFSDLVMKRQPLTLFHRRSIPRDAFLAINRAAMRGPSYYPLVPDTKHVSLVRPIWFIHDVVGINAGVWYYHPPNDRWSQAARGSYRIEAGYFCADQAMASDAAAVCVLIANVHYLLHHGGPDTYRLAHLEAGMVAHRIQLAAEAQELGAVANVNFYADELRQFLGLFQSGWEIISQVFIGAPLDPENPPLREPTEEEMDWRG